MVTTLEATTWQLVYSEVSPLAPSFTGAWTNRWLDFSTAEAMTAEELLAALADDRAIIEQHAVILSAYLWRYGTEEEAERWLLDITAYPRPDVYPESARTRAAIFWLWPFIGGLVTIPVIGGIFSKGGGDGGGTGGGITDLLSSIMPIIMIVMMMGLIMPMMAPKS